MYWKQMKKNKRETNKGSNNIHDGALVKQKKNFWYTKRHVDFDNFFAYDVEEIGKLF